MAPHAKRVRNITISKPIIYGNTATPFSTCFPKPIQAPMDHTHSWTVFVDDPTRNGDQSHIKKVVFKLHDTIKNPLRSIEQPPFTVTETGWGEFEILIKIFFVAESNEKPVQFYHHLKLHPYNLTNTNNGNIVSLGDGVTRKDGTVESILYDELIFNEPTEDFFKILTKKPGHFLYQKREPDNSASIFSEKLEEEELYRLEKAYKEIQEALIDETRKISSLQLDIAQITEETKKDIKQEESKDEKQLLGNAVKEVENSTQDIPSDASVSNSIDEKSRNAENNT